MHNTDKQGDNDMSGTGNIEQLLDIAHSGPNGLDPVAKDDALRSLGRYISTVVHPYESGDRRGELRIQDTPENRVSVSHKLASHHAALSAPDIRVDPGVAILLRRLERIGGSLERGESNLQSFRSELYGIAEDSSIGRAPSTKAPILNSKGPASVDTTAHHARTLDDRAR